MEFIRHLRRHLPERILLIWDGAAIHRSKLVQDHLASTKGRVRAERLPPYAPELNPVEYLWAHLKSHEIANLITTQAWELSFEATTALRKMRRRPSILAACFSSPMPNFGLDVTLLCESQWTVDSAFPALRREHTEYRPQR